MTQPIKKGKGYLVVISVLRRHVANQVHPYPGCTNRTDLQNGTHKKKKKTLIVAAEPQTHLQICIYYKMV